MNYPQKNAWNAKEKAFFLFFLLRTLWSFAVNRSRVGRVKRAPPKADRNRIGGARCALPTLQLFAFRT